SISVPPPDSSITYTPGLAGRAEMSTSDVTSAGTSTRIVNGGQGSDGRSLDTMQAVYERTSDRHARDLRFKHKFPIDHALDQADEAPAPDLDLLAQQVERIAGYDLAAKNHIVNADETQEGEVAGFLLVLHAAQLRASLDHQHARHQGPARNVT